MEHSEFINQTQRLCELFNKSLNDTQAEFWYMSLKGFDAQTYRIAVGEYAKKNKYMPTISDILAEIKKVREKQYQKQEEHPQEKVPCEKCGTTGLVKYIHDGYDYLCTCNCKNGRSLKLPMLRKFDEVFPHVDNHMQYAGNEYDLSQINF